MIESAPSIAVILLNILQFVLSIFGAFGIIGVVLAGVMYFTSGGNESQVIKAKKYFFYSIIGIVIGLASLIIINEIADKLN